MTTPKDLRRQLAELKKKIDANEKRAEAAETSRRTLRLHEALTEAGVPAPLVKYAASWLEVEGLVRLTDTGNVEIGERTPWGDVEFYRDVTTALSKQPAEFREFLETPVGDEQAAGDGGGETRKGDASVILFEALRRGAPDGSGADLVRHLIEAGKPGGDAA